MRSIFHSHYRVQPVGGCFLLSNLRLHRGAQRKIEIFVKHPNYTYIYIYISFNYELRLSKFGLNSQLSIFPIWEKYRNYLPNRLLLYSNYLDNVIQLSLLSVYSSVFILCYITRFSIIKSYPPITVE